jgi:hypothetical protein
MIYIYTTLINYEKYSENINFLLKNYEFIKKIIINEENDMYTYIINKNILYKNNILIDEINENLLKRLEAINYCDNSFLLNIKILDEKEDLSYITKYNVNILEFNEKNIKISEKYKRFIKLYNEIDEQYNITNIVKNNDIGIFGIETNEKNIIYKKCLLNNININNIDLSDKKKILSHKILLLSNDNLDNDLIINCIINNIIIINCKYENIIYDKQNLFLKKYSIDINYDICSIFILFIIKNYQQIVSILYKNLNIEKLMLEKIKKNEFIKNDKIFENIRKNENIGFIIVRHVNSEKTNNYWIESYKSIRNFYKNKIIIVDDNSNYEYVKSEDGLNIYNCEFIQSEYPCRGEILGYYYFYKNKFFEKAIIIHDSVFINKYIDFDKYGDIKFIWHFTHPWFDQSAEKNMIQSINYSEELEEYYEKKHLIHGCFGVQSVISYRFLYELENKYNLFNLLSIIDNRTERMNLERIFALICINENKNLSNEPSIFGIIHEYTTFGYSYEDYLKDKKNNNLKKDIIKVWTGR